jgi:hypothetical protein
MCVHLFCQFFREQSQGGAFSAVRFEGGSAALRGVQIFQRKSRQSLPNDLKGVHFRRPHFGEQSENLAIAGFVALEI